MDDKDLAAVGQKIAKRLFGPSERNIPQRIVRSRLRQIGDEIGEPIVPDDGSIPSNFVRVSLLSDGGTLNIAMPPSALEKILARL